MPRLVPSILAPGASLMRRMSYAGKFALISGFIAIPLSITLYFFIAEVNRGIQFAESELKGVTYIKSCRTVESDLLALASAVRGSGKVDEAVSRLNADVE